MQIGPAERVAKASAKLDLAPASARAEHTQRPQDSEVLTKFPDGFLRGAVRVPPRGRERVPVRRTSEAGKTDTWNPGHRISPLAQCFLKQGFRRVFSRQSRILIWRHGPTDPDRTRLESGIGGMADDAAGTTFVTNVNARTASNGAAKSQSRVAFEQGRRRDQVSDRASHRDAWGDIAPGSSTSEFGPRLPLNFARRPPNVNSVSVHGPKTAVRRNPASPKLGARHKNRVIAFASRYRAGGCCRAGDPEISKL
jgi:hypothetical protein